LEDKRRLKERLERIAGFRKPSRWSALAVVLLGALAVVGLTDPQSPASEDTTTDAAAAESAEYKPEKGESHRATLTARVVDPDGSPVVGAEVQLLVASPSRDLGRLGTDQSGEFPIPTGCGVVSFLVEAQGWVPKGGKVDPAEAEDPVIIRLEKGRTVSGRVLNDDGKPVEGAWVDVADLPKVGYPVASWEQWRARTDAAGRFTLKGVPKGEVVLGVSPTNEHRFYSCSAYHPVAAGGDVELRISTQGDFLFTGHVRDADTGEPITHFEIIHGQALGPPEKGRVIWQPRWLRVVDAEGAYHVGPDQVFAAEVRFLVTAGGYQPALSPVFLAYGSHQYEFRLTKGEEPYGVVVDSTGDPVSDAEVAMLDCGMVILGRGELTAHGSMPPGTDGEEAYTRTDAEGHFSLRAMRPNPTLIAVHRAYGFARITGEELAKTRTIRLLPFGKIEGVVELRGNPVQGQEVRITQGAGADLILLNYFVWAERTDAEGRFTFVGVPAGIWSIQLDVPYEPHPSRDGSRPRVVRAGEGSQRRWVTVKAGETTEAFWRNEGRVVTGRVLLGPGLEDTAFGDVVCDLYEAWDQTAAATDPPVIPHGYTVFCDETGRFRFEAVAARHYLVYPRLVVAGVPGLFEKPVEYDPIPVVIEPTAGGGTNDPLDVGVLTLR
ncbi:MAG: carboxypeptidase regulatory-like domain-containing protein, partial [Verrucomicrobiales bacterium]|nr:carboxypeptidase regulatory-like domain-containing protein [Verrucomicrobiales bacterium]